MKKITIVLLSIFAAACSTTPVFDADMVAEAQLNKYLASRGGKLVLQNDREAKRIVVRNGVTFIE